MVFSSEGQLCIYAWVAVCKSIDLQTGPGKQTSLAAADQLYFMSVLKLFISTNTLNSSMMLVSRTTRRPAPARAAATERQATNGVARRYPFNFTAQSELQQASQARRAPHEPLRLFFAKPRALTGPNQYQSHIFGHEPRREAPVPTSSAMATPVAGARECAGRWAAHVLSCCR